MIRKKKSVHLYKINSQIPTCESEHNAREGKIYIYTVKFVQYNIKTEIYEEMF